MRFESICISSYDFTAEERYMAVIILEYLEDSSPKDIKKCIMDALDSRDGLKAFVKEAFVITKADSIRATHQEGISGEGERYKEIVEAYQQRLSPEIFAENATNEFLRFLSDCRKIAMSAKK